jgi:hypothetical protein
MRQRSWKTRLVAGIAVLLVLAGCTTTPPQEEPQISLSNSNSNLANGGFYLETAGWRFHPLLIEGESLGVRLVKSKSTGELVELSDDFASYLQVADDVLYYRKNMLDQQDPEGYGIFRINLDGTDRQRIGTDQALHLLVLKDRLVYVRYQLVSGKQQYDLVSTTLEGTDVKVLSEGYSSTVQWVDHRLVMDAYRNDQRVLISMNLDGTDEKVLITDDFLNFMATDERIVVAVDTGEFNAEELGKIDLVEIDALGEQRQPITTVYGEVPVLVDDTWITVVNHNDNHLQLYRMKWDGSGLEVLLDHDVWSINQIGNDYVFYDEVNPDEMNLLIQQLGYLYRMNPQNRTITKLP